MVTSRVKCADLEQVKFYVLHFEFVTQTTF
jgi:hypothetical protein